jgi:uncharacterized membrane protein
MSASKERRANHQVEEIIGDILRAGVAISATVVLIGGISYLINYGGDLPHYRIFRGEPSDLGTVSEIVRDALSLRRRGLIQFGLLLLLWLWQLNLAPSWPFDLAHPL